MLNKTAKSLILKLRNYIQKTPKYTKDKELIRTSGLNPNFMFGIKAQDRTKITEDKEHGGTLQGKLSCKYTKDIKLETLRGDNLQINNSMIIGFKCLKKGVTNVTGGSRE